MQLRDHESASDLVMKQERATAAMSPSRAPHVRIVIESDLAPQFAGLTEAQLISIATDATRAVRGTINATRATLSVDGREVEVYREPDT